MYSIVVLCIGECECIIVVVSCLCMGLSESLKYSDVRWCWRNDSLLYIVYSDTIITVERGHQIVCAAIWR